MAESTVLPTFLPMLLSFGTLCMTAAGMACCNDKCLSNPLHASCWHGMLQWQVSLVLATGSDTAIRQLSIPNPLNVCCSHGNAAVLLSEDSRVHLGALLAVISNPLHACFWHGMLQCWQVSLVLARRLEC